VKRPGRYEPILVVIYICMEIAQGISLYSYLHLTLAKMLFFFLSYMVFLQRNLKNKKTEQVLPRSRGRGR
jgi:hypothetical protein